MDVCAAAGGAKATSDTASMAPHRSEVSTLRALLGRARLLRLERNGVGHASGQALIAREGRAGIAARRRAAARQAGLAGIAGQIGRCVAGNGRAVDLYDAEGGAAVAAGAAAASTTNTTNTTLPPLRVAAALAAAVGAVAAGAAGMSRSALSALTAVAADDRDGRQCRSGRTVNQERKTG